MAAEAKDHWSSELYSSAASFVPKLTSKVVSYLDVQPGDKILDLGCGDGPLTFQVYQQASASGVICGLDSSPSMIKAAQQKYPADQHPNLTFHVQDCARFDTDARSAYLTGHWDKVFSNAAMHWILRDPEVRKGFFLNVHAALKPGGMFVFEQGGFGNVGELLAALVAGLIADGYSPVEARETSPWFFPTEDWMRAALEEAGFVVEKLELEYRPTRLTPEDSKGGGGLKGWIRIFGASFLEKAKDQDAFVHRVTEVLKGVITRPDDGASCVGYVRLRGMARKKP